MTNTKYRSKIGLNNITKSFHGDPEKLIDLSEKIRIVHWQLNCNTWNKKRLREFTIWHINQNISDFLINLGSEIEFSFKELRRETK